MQIILFGAPGVGKGTQAKILTKKFGIPHISTGEILRQAVSNKNELGKKVKAILDRGDLVPNDLMEELIDHVLHEKRCAHGFILDGFPRSIEQAKILEKVLAKLGKLEKPFVINLLADSNIIVKRLSQRRECKVCHNIVNLNYLEDESTCPNCGSKESLIKREDDEEEVIKNRLAVFEKTTKPVIEYLAKSSSIINIDATRPVKEVTQDIMDALETEKA